MSRLGIQARVVAADTVRKILLDHGLAEVIPQHLYKTVPTEPTIYPFQVDGHYLATSPEAYLKQIAATTGQNCFAISAAFRAMEGTGRWHQPEFLMAEWYQRESTWKDQLQVTQAVVVAVVDALAAQLSVKPPLPVDSTPWPRISWVALWQEHLNVDLSSVIDDQPMQQLAEQLGYTTAEATWEQLFYQICLNHIEPHLPLIPCFLTDYPARISPLAQVQPERSWLAQRFELLIQHVELANGNTESFEAFRIKQLMAAELESRQLPLTHLDNEFIETLRQLTGQQWAGVGLGIDRLAAWATSLSVIEVQRVNGIDS